MAKEGIRIERTHFSLKIDEKYIYTMYIYSKSTKMAKIGKYPMGILWV